MGLLSAPLRAVGVPNLEFLERPHLVLINGAYKGVSIICTSSPVASRPSANYALQIAPPDLDGRTSRTFSTRSIAYTR
jgi:hypothetical protein